PGGLVFLNACRTAEAGPTTSFLEVLHDAGFGGMIGTEQQTLDEFANTLGLDFLEGFLERGQPTGPLLRPLRRQGLPLGLLYGAYCPPHIHVREPANQSAEPVLVAAVPEPAQPPGSLLGAPTPAEAEPPDLPDRPYLSLAPYDRE